jgi:hypothetical protein
VSEGVFDVSPENGSVTITLKAETGHDVPWIVIRYTSVTEALEGFKKNDGADLMELMRNVAGASKAFKAVYNNRDLPPRSQGKPEGAGNPSPQVTMGTDVFKTEDDAPPFGETPPSVPSCKHGDMKLVTHKGTKGYVCASGLDKNDPNRCPSVMV